MDSVEKRLTELRHEIDALREHVNALSLYEDRAPLYWRLLALYHEGFELLWRRIQAAIRAT
jgi:hypothetical protein